MSRKITSLLLIAVMLLSCLSFPGFAADDSVLYLNDYSQTAIPAEQEYVEYFYTNTGSAWFENLAGSWAISWITNDESSKDGSNYFAVKAASQGMYFITNNGTDGTSPGRISTKKCFTLDFSFNSVSEVPLSTSTNPVTLQVNIFPEKSTTSNGRSGEGTILTIPVGSDITVVNDATEETAEAFATEMDVWYDVKIDVDQTASVPTFTASIKKSADEEYTVLAENVSFPKSGDYSNGLGMWSILEMDSYRLVAVDDIKIETYEKKIAPTVSAVFATGSGSVGKTLTGIYEYAGYPEEGDSEYQWLVSDTEEGTYAEIEGAVTKTLSLSSSLKGKYVKFKVTPVNADGDKGEAVLSPAVKIIESNKEYGVDNLNNLTGDLKVAFIGGSITFGTGASAQANRYSTQLINNYFKQKFPNKTITEINTGIGGTPSTLGLMRLNREISSQAPDVVFVEYAVNDHYFSKEEAQRQYEGIVRQLLKLPKQPVVIPLYTCMDGLDETTAMYQQEIADYYGLGSVNFISYIKNNGGADAWKGLSSDGTHPNNVGHAKYAEIAISAFDTAYNQYFKSYEVPEEVYSDHEFVKTQLVPYNEKDRVTYEGDFFTDPSDSQKDAYSGYAHWGNGSVTSTSVGDKITFKFKGSSIGLWAMRGAKYGTVSYTIDGVPGEDIVCTNNNYNMAFPMLFRCDLTEGEHTLVIENKGGGTENLFTLGYFFTDNDYELKPNCENVTIFGPMEFGGVLSPKYEFEGEEAVSYRWLFSDNETGPFEEIPGATNKEWKITTTYANKYVRVEVTPEGGNSSQSASVQIPGTAETVVYLQTYEEQELGKQETSASKNWSSWFYNMAGSYANGYLLNDDYSVNGNYMAMTSLNTSVMRVLTTKPSKGTDGTLNFNRSFIAEYSFINFNTREDINTGPAAATTTVCMWPATLATNGRDDAAYNYGKLVEIVPGKSISVFNDSTKEALDDAFVPAMYEWYDLRIVTNLDVSSDSAPTYSVYLKKSADAEYTLIAENKSYPTAYSYAGGISTLAFLHSTQYAGCLGLDNIKLYYPPLKATAPTADNLTVTYDKMATGSDVTAKYDFVDANNDEEDLEATKFVWYRGDSEDGEFTEIENAVSGTYTLTEADENKYLKYTVTPFAKVEPFEGEPVTSDAFMGAFAPAADNIRLKEGAVVGRTVQAEFDYSDLNGDQPGAHKYQWYTADSADGTPEKIAGETKDSIEVTSDYADKYLFLEVTPVSAEKPYDGKAVMSKAFPVSSDNSAPVATEVKIDGNMVVGVAVTGTYKFTDPDGDSRGESIYRWYMSSSLDGDYVQIENQETDTLYLNETYQNKYIKFEVTPVDSAGMEGKPVRSEGMLVEGKLANELFVSLDGNDENDGTLESPLQTLEGARDKIRAMKEEGSLPAGGMTVYLRGGEYKIEKSFALTAEDSGTEDCPITYRNYRDEKVTISGKQDIDFSKFSAITDETMKNKLRSEEARSKVLVADLADIGLEDFEPIEKTNQSSSSEPLVFFDGEVMTLSRYPNTDVSAEWPKCWFSTKDAKYVGTQEGYVSRYGTGVEGTGFIVKYEDPVLDTWEHNSDQWLLKGYLKYYWAPETMPITIDTEKKFIRAKMQSVYGVEDGTEGRPFMVQNVYEELDVPGEWYIDTVNKKMYVYPINDNPSDFYMARCTDNLISVTNAENITFRGFDIRGGMANGVGMTDCDNVVIDNCEISGFAAKALRMRGGTNSGIKNSHMHHLGAGGAQYDENGDIPTMTKSNNFVINCEIHDFQLISTSYTAAVYIGNGVGNLISHNEIYNAEHCAIRFEGPFNIIEYNEFYDVVKTATDMAAVYTGRNVRTVGNEIRYNYFHNIGGNDGDHGTQAIFFDDGTSDNEVYGNVFGEHCGNTYAIKNYGGFMGYYYNNLFLNNPVIGQNGTWPYWKSSALGTDMQITLPDGTRIVDLENYQEMFPWMKKLSDNSFSDADYKAGANTFENNLFFGIDTLLADEYLLKRYGDQYYPFISKNNQVYNGNTEEHKAYFVDYENGDYTLTEDAYTKIRAKIPEFKEIPFLWMGRQSVVNEKPTVKNVVMNGTQTLSVTYDYQDAERDLEGETEFVWYWSDSKDGNYTKIDGVTSSMYQVDAEYFGKYVKVEITPVDEFGIAGATVTGEPVFVVAGEDSLQVLVEKMEAEVDSAKSGTELGQYPQTAINDMEKALDAAKKVLDGTDTETSIVDAAKALDAAYESFKGQQVTALKSDVTDGTITIPSDLRKLDLELGDVTGTIAIDGTKTLPATTVKATVNGVDITVEFPAGSKAGNIIEALQNPSAEVVGNHYLSAKFGVEGEAYSPAIKVTVTGGADLTLYTIQDGVHTNLNGENTDGNKVFELTEGSEILLTRLKVADTDATLKSLSINGKKIVAFKSNKYNYILSYDKSVGDLIVDAEATSPDAKVEIVQAESIPGKATITVTAQDKSVEPIVYTISLWYNDTEESPTPGSTPVITTPVIGTGAGGFAGSGSTKDEEKEPAKSKFTDIIGHWAEKDINEMAEKGIVSGVTATTFEPDRSITRAEFAALMTRALKLTAANDDAVFNDVASSAWYADEVAAAAAAGLIVGYDGNFRPDDTITREEMAVIIMKAYTFSGKSPLSGQIDKFADKNEISEWAVEYADQAVSVGLISGMTADTFAPAENATRAQVASIIKRLLDK